MLFGAPRQVGRPHRLLDAGELVTCLDDRGHMDLILEIRGGDVHGLGDSHEGVRLSQGACQRLFDDDSLQLGAAFHGLGDLAHDLQTGEVRGEDAYDIDGLGQFGDVRVDARVSKSVLAGHLGQFFGALGGADSCELADSHGTQSSLMKSCDKAGPNHAYLQHRRSPSYTQIRSAFVPCRCGGRGYAGPTPVGIVTTALCLQVVGRAGKQKTSRCRSAATAKDCVAGVSESDPASSRDNGRRARRRRLGRDHSGYLWTGNRAEGRRGRASNAGAARPKFWKNLVDN